MTDPNPWLRRGLLALAIGVGVVLLGLTVQLLSPLLSPASIEEPKQGKAKTPDFAYEAWYTLAVQDGRTKPFQTACAEAVRQITGRSRFDGLDPVGVVLAWMLDQSAGNAHGTEWETYPFILCDHHGLRRQILNGREGAEETGKYISPAELRLSPGFDRLLTEVGRKREELQGKAHLELTTEHLKAEEVGRRLMLFDALCGKSITRLFRNALAGDAFVDLGEYGDIVDGSPEQALTRLEAKQVKLPDPYHLVGLDRVPGSGWLSLSELRAMRRDPERWQALLARRLREMPERYLDAESREKLRAFPTRIKEGKGPELLAELKTALGERRDALLRQFEDANRTGDRTQANSLLQKLLPSPAEQMRFQQAMARAPKSGSPPPDILLELRAIVGEVDDALLQRLAKGIAAAEKSTLHNADFRMLQLDYLENLFPDLYRNALAAQPFPQGQVDAVLKAFEGVQTTYRSGKTGPFDEASRVFFRVLADTTDDNTIQGLAERVGVPPLGGKGPKAQEPPKGGTPTQARSDVFAAAAAAGENVLPYPGVSTIPLEIEFNRWQPFLWSWITMLAALILLALSLGIGGRVAYRLGIIVYLISLGIQTVGFAVRIAISSRAPVSNMYESVIFAAFMAACFALVLELIYRRAFIALAGATVATLGLVLADQLPLALDPKISPMVPVLRTNFWLTVHVLTIVSSYAAGTLAWGLGNLTLGLLVFGKGNPDTLKTLARYTYRALQLAVLLLAAGTFLGSWWAAESWGRFWGWDPKEVGALIALVCYVIPLHARYLGWVKDFGLAVAAVLCYASILLSWYVVNFLVAAGLHSYGFGSGGGGWVLWASLLNIEWVLIATLVHHVRNPVLRAA